MQLAETLLCKEHIILVFSDKGKAGIDPNGKALKAEKNKEGKQREAIPGRAAVGPGQIDQREGKNGNV